MYHKFRILILLSLLSGVSLNIVAQEIDGKALAKEYINQAELMMESAFPMVDVRDIYVLASEADPSNIVANYRAGDFYLRTVGKNKAVKYFLKVLELDPEYRFDITYWIGRSYQYGMEFEKALAFYSQYKIKLKNKDGYRGKDRTELPLVERRIYECENAIEYVANPAHVSIVNLGSAINSEYEDYGPAINEDETIMVFTSRRREGNLNENVFTDNKPYEDIFISVKENGKWGYAKNIGEGVNTPFHDSNLALSADGTQLFLYKDDNNGDIYETDKKPDGTWTFPVPLSEYINSEGFKESSISMSPDGKILFFSSDRPGGQGGIDIYYSIADRNGEWTRSKNLGPIINTEFDDDGPFIDYDGKTLYFSSQGRKGMGGYDIFKSTYDSAAAKWGEPVNLGYPINTPDDDIYFVSTKSGKRGYYASVRENGQGFTDIYMVTEKVEEEKVEPIARNDNKVEEEEPVIEEPVEATTKPVEKPIEKPVAKLIPVTLVVKVVDESNKPLEAKVNLVSSDNMTAGKSNKGPGIFEFKVTASQSKQYKLSVENSGYVFENIDVTLPGASTKAQSVDRTVRMRKLKIGTRSVLSNIYFKFDKATFKDESYNELNKLEGMMSQNSGMQIEISGHTDNIGSKDYNKNLSQRRANAVKDYLVKKGVDARRITAIGYGEERPLASNDDEKEGRELNRRVEFKVTGGK
jgi:outer membrane protein OmpA-like peptidoglycan-associated protein/tetratricopeptide (TPR) repeat protein